MSDTISDTNGDTNSDTNGDTKNDTNSENINDEEEWDEEASATNENKVIKAKSGKYSGNTSTVKYNMTFGASAQSINEVVNEELNIRESINRENIFYNSLQNFFDDKDRDSRAINNGVVKARMKSNRNLSNGYNAGGNLYIECTIPSSQSVSPNYVNAIINSLDVKNNGMNGMNESTMNGSNDTSAVTTGSSVASDANTSSSSYVTTRFDLMSILTGFIFDSNFITPYYFDNKLKSENGVPAFDLSKKLDEVNMCWNWNAGRDFTIQRVKEISNYYISKLNELIDYIITNDLINVDKTFSKIFLSMFANNSGIIYEHSNSTLLLPSLINWLSSKSNNGANNALSLCGYVKSGSQFFPNSSKSKWIGSNEDVTCSPCVEVDTNYNNLIKCSQFGFPFVSAAQNPTVAETPSSDIDYISSMGSSAIKFTKDNYKYSDSIAKLKSLKYAKQFHGSKDTKTINEPTTWYNQSKTITLNSKDIFYYDGESRQFPTSFYQKEGDGKCGPNTWTFHTLYFEWVATYKLRANDSVELKNIVLNQLQTENKGTLKNAEYEILGIEYTNKRHDVDVYVSAHDGNKYVYHIEEHKIDVKDCKINGKKVKQVVEAIATKSDERTIKDEPGIAIMPNAMTVQVKYNVTFDDSKSSTVYTGSFGSKYFSEDKESDKAICLYTSEMNLCMFDDNCFNYWYTILKDSNGQQLVLNELRRYIKNHNELILINKVNKLIGPYARSFKNSTLFVNVPIGPPLTTIPNSYVVEHRNYFPSFTVNQSIDENLISYDQNAESVNIVNSVSCEDSKNYLDMIFKYVISSSRFTSEEYTVNKVICIIIPSKGYQMFEVIDKSFISTMTIDNLVKIDDCTNSKSILYDYTVSKIVLSFKDFSSDSKLSTLMNAYECVASVYVPVVEFKYDNIAKMGDYENGNIRVSVNTMSEDDGTVEVKNKVWIYVSKDKTQELICKLAGNGGNGSGNDGKNIDKNNVINTMINVQYNGLDSEKTPTCLQLN